MLFRSGSLVSVPQEADTKAESFNFPFTRELPRAGDRSKENETRLGDTIQKTLMKQPPIKRNLSRGPSTKKGYKSPSSPPNQRFLLCRSQMQWTEMGGALKWEARDDARCCQTVSVGGVCDPHGASCCHTSWDKKQMKQNRSDTVPWVGRLMGVDFMTEP